MARGGIRKDAPQRAISHEIGYHCPCETWEYWEKLFSKQFSPKFRDDIIIALVDFSTYRKSHQAPALSGLEVRLDAKQIQRDLVATIKGRAYATPEIEQFVKCHSLRRLHDSPSELASDILIEFEFASEDFLIERPEPKPLFTRVFFDLFYSNGFNVSLGSAGTIYGENGMRPEDRSRDVPETPFVEFIRRCLWQVGPSASFCARVRKTIQNCPICSKLK